MYFIIELPGRCYSMLLNYVKKLKNYNNIHSLVNHNNNNNDDKIANIKSIYQSLIISLIFMTDVNEKKKEKNAHTFFLFNNYFNNFDIRVAFELPSTSSYVTTLKHLSNIDME